ncbi:cupin domain-containing protein [Flexivirga caeni]|uniref:LuxR family transcriptional regulator n=1 Tax=Flexivirga caeni TaxID=2294115 RepID=A0A3M9MEC2_9MICO|nr:cupin domain-containing protein [Flexivirga caeni]RNI23920.1 LuxR family transcriptional regulator [Flexivirga caeni]
MEKRSLTALGRQQLAAARTAGNGRSAHTVYGGHEHTLRQTLIALTAGSALSEHESPGEATLVVLQGHVQLTSAAATWDGSPGDHLIIPAARHALNAVEDSVVLLTVAKPRGAS